MLSNNLIDLIMSPYCTYLKGITFCSVFHFVAEMNMKCCPNRNVTP